MSVEMRKQPAQKRSQARIDRIIEVAETLICEKGLSELAIREVARASETNIASFYQYFPNRSALVRKIVEKHQALLHEMLKQGVAHARTLSVHAALSHMQNETVNFYNAHPVAAEIWPGTHGDHALRALNGKDNRVNIAMLAGLVRDLNNQIDEQKSLIIATLILTTTAPVTRVSLSLPDAMGEYLRQAQVEQLTRLIEAQ